MKSAPKAVQSRVDRLMCGVKERATREMSETVAGALLMGKAPDLLHFEGVESLDGVEEAILHIISSSQSQSGNEESAAKAARTTIENLRVEIEDAVKRAAARVKAKQGTGLWVQTRNCIADLIFDETLRCPSSAVGAEKEAGRTDRETPRVHYASATLGPATCRRLGMEVLSEGNFHRDGEAGPPQCADDYVLLGSQMEPALAMAEYQKALAMDPNHVMARLFLAESFKAVGNLEAAKVEFLRVTQLLPNDPDAHWELAEVLCDMGESEAAVAEYSYALRVAPEDEEIRAWYSLLDDWIKDRLPEQPETEGLPIIATSSPPLAPKKLVRIADLKKTPGGKFDLSGLTKSELADLLWEEAAEGEDKR